MSGKINLAEKFALFHDHWRPKIVAALNGQEIKLIKVHGEFPWHSHVEADEFFLVWKGIFRVEFRDRIVTEEEVWGGASRDGKLLINDRIADSVFQQILTRTSEYDVFATPNLNGDYLSDACAAQVG